MPTDLGMKYITRHVLGTCRHTRHFYLDPYICTTSYYQNTLQNGLEKTLIRHFLIETMSNKSTKSVSSKRPNQKGIGSPNPDIKIVDTSRTTSRGTSLVGAEPVEEVHPQYTNEPLRMRIEYK